MNNLILPNNGKMQYKVFNPISYNEYKFDILKSALQKYIRRNEENKAIYSVIEMELFKFLKEKSTAIRSNIRNRILICLNEDVSITEYNIYNDVFNLMILWEETRKETRTC